MGNDLDQVARTAADMVPALTGVAESGGVLGVVRQRLGRVEDRLTVRRETAWAQMTAEAIETLRVLNVPSVAIRDKTLRAIYEHGTLEDDPDLARLWVNLLTGVLGGADTPPAYPAILQQLEAIEARFLNAAVIDVDRHLPQPGLYLDHMEEVQPLLLSLEWRHLDNLERLRLLTFEYSGPVNVVLPSQPRDRELSVSISVTRLGRALVEACSRLKL